MWERGGSRAPLAHPRSLTPNHLNIVPQRNGPHVAKSRPADGCRPVVVRCSSTVLRWSHPSLLGLVFLPRPVESVRSHLSFDG